MHVPYDDVAALDEVLDPATVAAVLLEPLQGEGGVVVPSSDYLAAVQALCTERNVLLMLDEVQTGLGRTGHWFAFQAQGLRPDVVTMAKALGNGMPVGACWARAEVGAAFGPGDHGSTFGGQPLALSAARATLAVMEAEDVCRRAREKGPRLAAGLRALPGVVSVRAPGSSWPRSSRHPRPGRSPPRRWPAVCSSTRSSPDAVRLAPPLLVSDDEVDRALSIFNESLSRWRRCRTCPRAAVARHRPGPTPEATEATNDETNDRTTERQETIEDRAQPFASTTSLPPSGTR